MINKIKKIIEVLIPWKIYDYIIVKIIIRKFKKIDLHKSNIFSIYNLFNWNLSIGSHTYIWPNWKFFARWEKIIIGRYCSIADNFYAITYNHSTAYLSYHVNQHNNIKLNHELKHWDIIIWNDVWIWHNCTVLSWVTIGNWAVIWAWAVVTKDVPPYAIVWWNPAKVIKYRFSKQQIEAIEKLEWWNWSDKKILENSKLFNTKVDNLSLF